MDWNRCFARSSHSSVAKLLANARRAIRAVGLAGAVVGGYLMTALGFSGSGGFTYSVIVAVIGAVVLLWLIHMITGRRPNP